MSAETKERAITNRAIERRVAAGDLETVERDPRSPDRRIAIT
jgi:hypothetical protein